MDEGDELWVDIENAEHVAVIVMEMANPHSKFKDIYMYVVFSLQCFGGRAN